MKKTYAIGLALTSIAALSSCSSVKSIPVEAISGEWDIIKVNGNKVNLTDPETTPYLAFDVVNGRFYGNGGCNYMMGTFATGEGNEIEITTAGQTLMMCPDIEFQDSLMKTISDVRQYTITKKGDLELSAANDRTLITLEKRPDAISPACLAGEWKITKIGEYDFENNDSDADTPTITFFPEDSTFSMTTDCNNIGGNYNGIFVDIRFTGLRSTRMACPDMSIEQAATKILPTITSFSKLGEYYAFYDNENNPVMEIAPMH